MKNIYKIAFLVSLSCALQIAESLIPHPIPGLRLGLANIITLIALVNLSFGCALEITLLRTLLSSFMMGSFMSPGFILSLCAGLCSTLVMGFFYQLRCVFRAFRLSIIGISIVGALTHNLVQLSVAYLVLVRHPRILIFLPWLSLGAVVTGWLTGIIAGKVLSQLKGAGQSLKLAIDKHPPDYPDLVLQCYHPADTLIHRLPSQVKIAGVFVLSLFVSIFNNFWLFLVLFLFWAIIVVISQDSFIFLFSKAKRYASLVAVSFLFPLCFNSDRHLLAQINTGLIFAWRILFLILISSLLARTTSPKELTQGLAKLLLPLRFLGISEERIANVLSLSWAALPIFWEMAKENIRTLDLKKIKHPRNLFLALSDLMVKLLLY